MRRASRPMLYAMYGIMGVFALFVISFELLKLSSDIVTVASVALLMGAAVIFITEKR